MATLTIELPSQKKQTVFNLRRWAELVADPELAKIEGRIETDRHGHIIMTPPPGFSHGGYQAEIAHRLRMLLPHGRTATECPISTLDGVKAADVAWISNVLLASIGERVCLTHAPEICVEVLSPGNTRPEMTEKKSLYFAAGAREVWFCGRTGTMAFFSGPASSGEKSSKICPAFPRKVEL
jgi:Uma2 family endonuclease